MGETRNRLATKPNSKASTKPIASSAMSEVSCKSGGIRARINRFPASGSWGDAYNAHPYMKAQQALGPAVIGAIGVVFGDIGTSPLYALGSSLDAAQYIPGEAHKV